MMQYEIFNDKNKILVCFSLGVFLHLFTLYLLQSHQGRVLVPAEGCWDYLIMVIEVNGSATLLDR